MSRIGEQRLYRNAVRQDHLIGFDVTVKETDLRVYAQKPLGQLVREKVLLYRGYIESYINRNPEFAASLLPLTVREPAPKIVREMASAGQKAGVGPMAAVAGAIAQFTGEALIKDPEATAEVIIENGGDVFVKTSVPVTVGIFAGTSQMTLRLGLRVDSAHAPMGVCTSSGTLGHSLSMGRADAACVVSRWCALADAAATAIGNRVKTKSDIRSAIAFGKQIDGVDGIVVIKGKELGVWGALELVPLKLNG